MTEELTRLRALRDYILEYERCEMIRDDYWDEPKGVYATEYLEQAVQMAKESPES